MFYQQSNASTTLPRDFRFHHDEGIPQTPEPTTMADELQAPCAPRPARLRVKRRNISNLQAPTEQFLASVAAADVPVPTIEVNHSSLPSRTTAGPSSLPHVNIFEEDSEMPDSKASPIGNSFLLAPHQPYGRMGLPPQTPEPESVAEQESSRPSWSMGGSLFTSNEDQFPRPNSAMSTASECSDDSFYSGGPRSHLSQSEDGSCTSPDSDVDDPFQFPSMSPSLSKASSKFNSIRLSAPVEFAPLNQNLKSKTRKNAPWSKAMSAHLWSTYVLYLQDPTVTPFRANGVPPEGVCHRVAREAKRSWKGPQTTTQRSHMRSVALSEISDKSGSLTPTPETSTKLYAQWPHSSGATRSHLRELCRKETTAVQRHRHFQSRNSTPFTRAKSYDSPRVSESGSGASTFNTKDIALSLATSTSSTMQPDGPLASLAQDAGPTPNTELSSRSVFRPSVNEPPASIFDLDDPRVRRLLGSPFIRRTYGPSSSQLHRRPSPPRHLSDTSAPRLRSPLRFDQPRSLNSTQKRRAQYSLDDEVTPGPGPRPNILDQKLFGTPLGHSRRRVRSRGFSLGDEAFRQNLSGVFRRPPPEFDLAGKLGLNPNETRTHSRGLSLNTSSNSPFLPPTTIDPPRLGSPFTETGPNQTFPRRLFQDSQSTIRRGAFATMHQSRHSINSFDFGPSQQQSRLERLDEKLKEIRQREDSMR
ncbi:hypothetical protein GLAREA_02236 [Glarea lozoyensis ATCC 20868]|uniref:Uncharacterized protein n=1 Tax=Glarea lozoyensis (strain ATCC 20868 / MF5171) TaxID=1116229 RepID=S3CMA0_GLAL2|nr:uncharacterized protein GLAREA_02236 [Glarea lozoyensis ATCC 20868]EPE26324.1 hypothetical protein GLAREA_02236 [Glarea lozoyensis ATCC 20868]